MREKNTTRHGGAAIGAMARADTTSFRVFEKKEKKKWDEAESVAERRPHPRRGYRGIFL